MTSCTSFVGRSEFLPKMTPSLVAGGKATKVSQELGDGVLVFTLKVIQLHAVLSITLRKIMDFFRYMLCIHVQRRLCQCKLAI